MRTPQLGDQVLYHPRPSDRVRKPDNLNNSQVVHTATVAHIDGAKCNLSVLDSGGYPYAVQNVRRLSRGEHEPEFGGWWEFPEDAAPIKREEDPMVYPKEVA